MSTGRHQHGAGQSEQSAPQTGKNRRSASGGSGIFCPFLTLVMFLVPHLKVGESLGLGMLLPFSLPLFSRGDFLEYPIFFYCPDFLNAEVS